MRRLLVSTIVVFFACNSFAYYQAQQGRWMSRDPVEEDGGVNLYLWCLNDSLNFWDPFGLRAYHADCPRHKLAAEDQNMKKYADAAKALAKARMTNGKQKWGPVEKGSMKVVASGSMSKKQFLNAILNDKDSTPQFYGHGYTDNIMWTAAGSVNPSLKLTIADWKKVAPQLKGQQGKIGWTTFELYSCLSAGKHNKGTGFAETMSTVTGRSVSGNIGFNTLKVDVWSFDNSGNRIIDTSILKPYQDLAEKLTDSTPNASGAANYTVDKFKKDWEAQSKKDAGKCAEFYWDIYQKEYVSRKSYP